jgi:hypothetical protein
VLSWGKPVLVVMTPVIIGASVAAWIVVPSLLPKPAPEMPAGYVRLWIFDNVMVGTKLNPPARREACTVVGVNNSGKTVESILFQFSTQAKLTLAEDSSGFGSTQGDFQVSKALLPGEHAEYVTLPAPGSLEWIKVGWGEKAKTHTAQMRLVAGKRLVISYEPDGKVSTRLE